jgi:hypothetical protein
LAIVFSSVGRRRGAALSLLVGGECVVLLKIAERRLGATEWMGRHRRSLATWIDADLHRLVAHRVPHPGVVLPRLGL